MEEPRPRGGWTDPLRREKLSNSSAISIPSEVPTKSTIQAPLHLLLLLRERSGRFRERVLSCQCKRCERVARAYKERAAVRSVFQNHKRHNKKIIYNNIF